MSITRRCRFCRDLHNAAEHPELEGVCIDCWYDIQEYLKERGMLIVVCGKEERP